MLTKQQPVISLKLRTSRVKIKWFCSVIWPRKMKYYTSTNTRWMASVYPITMLTVQETGTMFHLILSQVWWLNSEYVGWVSEIKTVILTASHKKKAGPLKPHGFVCCCLCSSHRHQSNLCQNGVDLFNIDEVSHLFDYNIEMSTWRHTWSWN